MDGAHAHACWGWGIKRLGGQIVSVHYTTLRNVGFVNRPWEAMEGFGGSAYQSSERLFS